MGILGTQTISIDARIDGRKLSNVIEVNASGGFEQINAECTIWVPSRPSWADERSAATVWASNGTNSGQIFGGEVVSFDWTYYPTKVGIICQGLLARTREAWGGAEYDYTEQDDAAIIRNLLEKKSIPSSVASILSSSWTLGVITPITLKEGDTPYSIIQEIDDLAGFKTYELLTGVIVRRRVAPIAGSSAALSYSRGVNILASPKRNRTRLGIINRAIITGVEFEGLTVGGPGVGEASAANPYVKDPSGYITENTQSDLVEDNAKALEIAKRIVSDKNSRPESVDFEVPFDPRPQPGMTLALTHAELEFTTTAVFCQYVSHDISASGAKTTLRTTGGALTPVVTGQDPVAAFDLQMFLEGQDSGTSITALYDCVADGTTSFDPDGTIASYAWTITPTGGTATPSSGSTAVLRFVLEGAVTQVVVSLTVTDNDGNTNTLARTIGISGATVYVEDLYTADGSGNAACSSDGQQTWKTQTPASGSATCLAPFAPDWGEIWGTSTGHIYASIDKLRTALVDLGQPHGAVACTAVWIHETDTTRAWAGFSDGKVYYGEIDTTVPSAVWTQMGTVPDSPVIEIRESIGSLNELRATAGAGYYYSTNGGASWTLVHTFNVARRMAAGYDQNMATGLNTTPPIFGEDVTPTVPGGVTHLRGITFGWRIQALYSADNAAALYTTDSTFAAFTAHADTTDGQANHMIRSGNIDGVIYIAIGDGTGSNNGFQKWIPGTKAPFYIRKTGSNQGLMIGYGPAHLPPVNVDLLMIKTGASNAPTVYYYDHTTATWLTKTGDLPNGTQAWWGIVASPLDPKNEWIAWTSAEAYRTTNNGTNWTQLTGIGSYAASQNGGGSTVLTLREIEFSPTVASRWVAVGDVYQFPRRDSVVSLGNGNSVTTEASWMVRNLFTNGVHGPPHSIAWLIGTEFVVYTARNDGATVTEGSQWLMFDTATLSNSSTGTAFGGADSPPLRIIDALSTSGQVAGEANENITTVYAVGDVYTSQGISIAPTKIGSVTSTSRASATLTVDGIYVGGTAGITKYAYTAPTTAVSVAHASDEIDFIRAGHARRQAIAALVNIAGGGSSYQIAVSDGSNWSDISQPTGVTFGPFSNVSNWVEVLEV